MIDRAPFDALMTITNRPELIMTHGEGAWLFDSKGGHQRTDGGVPLAGGVDCSYLRDVAVHPAYQGIGLCKEMITRLVHDSRTHRKSSSTPLLARISFTPSSAFAA